MIVHQWFFALADPWYHKVQHGVKRCKPCRSWSQPKKMCEHIWKFEWWFLLVNVYFLPSKLGLVFFFRLWAGAKWSHQICLTCPPLRKGKLQRAVSEQARRVVQAWVFSRISLRVGFWEIIELNFSNHYWFLFRFYIIMYISKELFFIATLRGETLSTFNIEVLFRDIQHLHEKMYNKKLRSGY